MAVKAARMIDVRDGNVVERAVVLIRGDRITDAGSGLAIAAGDPLRDVSELERVRFVMKGGKVVKQ